MELLIGIAIGILYVIVLDPLLRNISDLISCLLTWGQMVISKKVAGYEAEIMEIRGTQELTPEESTRVIGFSVEPDEEEEEYDDDDY